MQHVAQSATAAFSVCLQMLQSGSCQPQGRVIGAYAICLRAEQRTLRCLRLADGGEMSSWLARELHPSSVGCTNWKPTEHPEWLLLEVDNDFCIREQQVSVAKSMMFEGTENPEDMQNRLMQLNMGEGKMLESIGRYQVLKCDP